MRRLGAVLLTAALVLVTGGCSDDDDGSGAAAAIGDAAQQSEKETAGGTATTGTTRAPLDPDDPACREVQVLLKPEVTADQKAAIEEKLDDSEGVDKWRFDAKGSGGPSYRVVPASPGAEVDLDQEFAMDGVVSVLHPAQVC